ncbi:genetic competence negative regulator [Paenibacillus albiflavus]|uniref:Genetic competence negative regulator n=1 Tax=Paenibacillus albiflavus TaxID=2545760 RepID=A0A4R4EP48_9BACL|nr:genetic competence negative regulator [Paenibacillus albiflavus]TCZ81240.1 genetic competence negative regulator [Paenibacillus albiflavus]
MKMERLGQDKIRIFLTFDDLSERGIPKDDMLKETYKLRELFIEMMDQAYSELGFDPSGPLAVEVFSMPAQGMVVIVTSTSMEFYQSHEDALEDSDAEEIYAMEVMLEQSDIITFVFEDFEDVIRVSKIIHPIANDGGALYKYKDKWILQFEQMDLEESQFQNLIAVLSEYGEVSSITQAVLQEYGHTVMQSEAVKQLCNYF